MATRRGLQDAHPVFCSLIAACFVCVNVIPVSKGQITLFCHTDMNNTYLFARTFPTYNFVDVRSKTKGQCVVFTAANSQNCSLPIFRQEIITCIDLILNPINCESFLNISGYDIRLCTLSVA